MSREERLYSVSQISLYLACPLKYRFQYVDQLPKAFRPAALAFGGAIHSAIEWFHRARMSGASPPLDAVLKVFEADWFAQNLDPLTFHFGETREALETKARAMLSVYLGSTNGCRPAAVEEPFALEIADPETGECLDVPFRGIVDLVEEDGTLVDLKTAARATPQDDVDRHLQLSSYALAVFLKTGEIPKLRLDVLLKTSKPRLERIPTSRSLTQLAWVAHLIQRTSWAIEEGHFFPNPSWRCNDCEYLAACQAWRGPDRPQGGTAVAVE
jgi:putative RecB family exonuclease